MRQTAENKQFNEKTMVERTDVGKYEKIKSGFPRKLQFNR